MIYNFWGNFYLFGEIFFNFGDGYHFSGENFINFGEKKKINFLVHVLILSFNK